MCGAVLWGNAALPMRAYANRKAYTGSDKRRTRKCMISAGNGKCENERFVMRMFVRCRIHTSNTE